MCFDVDAVPPDLPPDLALPPIAGGAAAEALELSSADGTRFLAALAESPAPRAPAVLILPDVRGLYRFYSELAERFAQAGHHAIALDYFGRTAGVAARENDWEYMPHVDQTTLAGIQADAAAAIAALRDRTGARDVVAVGFCFGGLHAFLAAASPLDLAGVVGFYGALDGSRRGLPSPADVATEMSGPVLGLFGGDDAAIPPAQVAHFDERLGAAGVEHEIVTYPGAPHSFFDRKFAEYADACEDAWRRTLHFLQGIGERAPA
jgi:carboxymethylenebutenolidase